MINDCADATVCILNACALTSTRAACDAALKSAIVLLADNVIIFLSRGEERTYGRLSGEAIAAPPQVRDSSGDVMTPCNPVLVFRKMQFGRHADDIFGCLIAEVVNWGMTAAIGQRYSSESPGMSCRRDMYTVVLGKLWTIMLWNFVPPPTKPTKSGLFCALFSLSPCFSSNYMMFEVLETSWGSLQERLDSAKTLDEVINAHNAYLSNIHSRALLHPDSKDVYDKLIQVSSCHVLCSSLMYPYRPSRTILLGGMRSATRTPKYRTLYDAMAVFATK